MNVYFSLGSKCNLNCIYCYNDTLPNLSTYNIRPIGHILMERIVRYLENKYGRIRINFTGGEPLIYKNEIFQLLQNISDLKDKIENPVITTNGTLLNESILDTFKEIDTNIIFNISIDGPPSIHNLTRKSSRIKDTYKLAINGLNILKINGFKTYLNSVITKYHIEFGAQNYYQYMKSLKTPFLFGKGSFVDSKLNINETQFVDFVLELIEIWENDTEEIDVIWLDGILSYIYYSQNNLFDEHCGSKNMLAFAGNEGLIWACPRFIPYKDFCFGVFDEETFEANLDSGHRKIFEKNFEKNICTYELELFQDKQMIVNNSNERKRLFDTLKKKLEIN